MRCQWGWGHDKKLRILLRNFFYLLMSWAIVTQRAAISPLVFVNRSSMAIDISFVRHQFMTEVTLIFFVIHFQVFFHLHDVVEKLTTHGTRRYGVNNRSSFGNGRIFLLLAMMIIFKCLLTSNWNVWKYLWWRGWCIRYRRILLIIGGSMIFQILWRNWNLGKRHLTQSRLSICSWKVNEEIFKIYLDFGIYLFSPFASWRDLPG